MSTPVTSVAGISSVKALQHFLKKAPTAHAKIGQFASMSEGVLGNQHTRFIQSVASVWLPKAIVARSLAEQAEQAFLEFVETALFFYSLPFLAKNVFLKALPKISGSKIPVKYITKSYADLAKHHPKVLNKVAPLKAALVIGSLSAIIAEYSLSFFKNLQTEKIFRKSKFSDVVNLSQGTMAHDEKSAVAEKAYKRIKQCAVATAGVLAGAAALAAFGSKSKGLQNLSKGLIKNFDFSFKNGQIGLSKPLLLTIIWAGVASYLDASRDKLETQEILTRVAGVVAPYYSFGKELLESATVRLFGRQVPKILTPEKTGTKSFEVLAGEALQQASQKLSASNKPVTQAAVLREANTVFQPLLKAKNNVFFWPFAFGVTVVGFATALLSQYWTKVRFEQSKNIKQHAAIHPEEVLLRTPQLYDFPQGYKGQQRLGYAGYPVAPQFQQAFQTR